MNLLIIESVFLFVFLLCNWCAYDSKYTISILFFLWRVCVWCGTASEVLDLMDMRPTGFYTRHHTHLAKSVIENDLNSKCLSSINAVFVPFLQLLR